MTQQVRNLASLLHAQLELQIDSMSGDPRRMEGEDRANFVRSMAYALEDEIHEATQEVKWKPWLTADHGVWVDRDAYVKELVDAFHFFMNMLILAAPPSMSMEELATEFIEKYFAKRQRNAQRQIDGYTGEKGEGGRELDDPDHQPSEAVLEHIRRQKENGHA